MPDASEGTPDEPVPRFLEEVRRDEFLLEEDVDTTAPDEREVPEILLVFFLLAFLARRSSICCSNIWASFNLLSLACLLFSA